jgi:hydrogenase expression/formation protein HypD
MKYIDEYRDGTLIKKLTAMIRRVAKGNYTFMEVCGGHTAAIRRFGIPSILPDNIKLISGPGCPVCVTGNDYIDKAIAYSRMDDVIITTFGDLVRVPGSLSTLEKEKSMGADIRIVFSGLEAIEIAKKRSEKRIIFLGIGFETTAPGTAATVKEAEKHGIKNFYVLSAHKVMPPAMDVIIKEGIALNGFICPGHVATITGSSEFSFIPLNYKLGCVITGFEPVDLLQSIYMLVNQTNNHLPDIEIQYTRAVTQEGNKLAKRMISDVFMLSDATWRGFGIIPSSGLKLRDGYRKYDAESVIPVSIPTHVENKSCICGEILRGLKVPSNCSLFGGTCVPENPVGACMVSNEGACNAYFKYGIHE